MIKSVVLVASVSRQGGGLFQSVRRLHQLLAEDGVAVTVLSLADAHTAADLPAWQPLVPRSFPPVGYRAFGYSPEFNRALRQEAPDIVHAHGLWMYPSVACLNWARRTRRPYMISAEGMLDPWAVRNSRWKKILAGRLYQDAHLREARCLRALCESEAQAMRAYGLRNPICVVPNGVDLPTEIPQQSPPWSGQLGADRKVLLYLGRLHPKKGLPNLLQAWQQLPRRDWALVVAGWDDGGHEAELRRTIAELGIQDSAFLIGPQFGADKAAAYQQADAFILPSYSEGLPMVILEAWANRLPVLMTDQCNLPEGFAGGAAGRISLDVVDMARELNDFLSMSEADRQTMGGRGRVLIERHFSWKRIGAEMRAVYEWILTGKEKPACVMI